MSTDYRITIAGETCLAAQESGRTLKHLATARCTRILQAHPEAIRVEAWRDGAYLAKATRAPSEVVAAPVVDEALDFSVETMSGGRTAAQTGAR